MWNVKRGDLQSLNTVAIHTVHGLGAHTALAKDPDLVSNNGISMQPGSLVFAFKGPALQCIKLYSPKHI